MSGFLNKKDRVIDFSLTDRGLELMSKNNLDFSYATVSDRSIVYKEDYDSQELRKISDSEFFYNSFEVSTSKENNDFFRFEESTKDYYLFEYKSKTRLEDLINRKNLSTSDIRFDEDIKFKDSKNPSIFNISNSRRYPSIMCFSYLDDKTNIIDDSRFKHKTNMKFLPPSNAEYDFGMNNDYKETGFLNFIKGFDYSSANENIDIQLIDYLEGKEEILRFYFEIDSKSKNDYFMFDINQVDKDNRFRELKIIKYKKILDKNDNKIKTIFLVGKFLSDVESKKYSVLDHEELKTRSTTRFRKEFIFEQTANKLYLDDDSRSISNFNTIDNIINSKFINIFTVIVE